MKKDESGPTSTRKKKKNQKTGRCDQGSQKLFHHLLPIIFLEESGSQVVTSSVGLFFPIFFGVTMYTYTFIYNFVYIWYICIYIYYDILKKLLAASFWLSRSSKATPERGPGQGWHAPLRGRTSADSRGGSGSLTFHWIEILITGVQSYEWV